MEYIGKLNEFQTQSSSPITVMLASTSGQRIIVTEDKEGKFNIKFE